MKITFLGTGASEGVPAMFCSCPYCEELRRRGASHFRTRSQVLIDEDISVDFPSEAFVHSLRFGVDYSALKYILVTHSHMDHFYAHDFILRGYKYAKLKEDYLTIFGNEEIKRVFSECTAREMKPDVASRVGTKVVHAYDKFEVGDYRVIALPAVHGTKEEALLYYIERGGKGYLHLYDTGTLSDAAINFLAANSAKANAVAYDCTFLDAPYEEGRRHMCAEGVARLHEKLVSAGVCDKNTKKIITHFSHNSNPTEEHVKAVEEKFDVVAAYDGFVLNI